MKEKDFLDGINNIDFDVVEQFVCMDNKLQTKSKSKRLWTRIGAIAACFALVISAVVVVPMLQKSDEFKLPTHIDNIIWDERTRDIISEETQVPLWNGWNVDSIYLYEKLEEADPEQYFALHISKSFWDGYIYKGKKVSEIVAEKDEKYMLMEKLSVLIKEGDALKYGDLLYTEGTPNGEKWAKSYYDERIQYYGTDFLSKYIFHGQFDKEQAEKDRSEANEEAEQLQIMYDEAYKSYHSSYVDDAKEIFSNLGLCTVVKNKKLFVFIKKEELANLDIGDKETYRLSLAKRRNYEHEEGNIPTFENNVTGFALEKIECFTLKQSSGVVKSDYELIDKINALIKESQFDTDRIAVMITSSEALSDDMFRDMNYESIRINKKYPKGTRVSMYIKYENINLKALKELSNMENVEYIRIYTESSVEEFAAE